MMRMPRPEGSGITHAEIKIGDSIIMLAGESSKMGAYGPVHYKGTPITLFVYVPDVDATTKQAEAAGARITRSPHFFFAVFAENYLQPAHNRFMGWLREGSNLRSRFAVPRKKK